MYFPGKTIEAAKALAIKWNGARGISEEEQLKILASSMRLPKITVVYDGDNDSYGILEDGDEVLHLDWDQTMHLVAALCRKLLWEVPDEYKEHFSEEEDAEEDE